MNIMMHYVKQHKQTLKRISFKWPDLFNRHSSFFIPHSTFPIFHDDIIIIFIQMNIRRYSLGWRGHMCVNLIRDIKTRNAYLLNFGTGSVSCAVVVWQFVCFVLFVCFHLLVEHLLYDMLITFCCNFSKQTTHTFTANSSKMFTHLMYSDLKCIANAIPIANVRSFTLPPFNILS